MIIAGIDEAGYGPLLGPLVVSATALEVPWTDELPIDVDDLPCCWKLLKEAVAKKPTVLIFYRGGWCPFCNAQMSGLEGVQKELTDAGYQLLAISPDKPEELGKSVAKHTLTYTLLSDSDAVAIKAFGLAFTGPAGQFKMLEQYSGEHTHALPVPAVYVVGRDGVIKFVHSDANYRVRMDPEKIVEAAKAAVGK
mgnify:CR=1 FL=1